MAKRQFAAEARAVIAVVKKGGDPKSTIKAQRKKWQRIYQSLYVSVARDFAPRTIGQLKAARPGEVKADAWLSFVLDYVRHESGTKIRGIEATTLDKIRAALAAGTEAGEGSDQLAKRVGDVYTMFGQYRSAAIARTEVVGASNLGSRAGALSTGLKLRHQWLTTRDGRERDWHGDVDGQDQTMDDPYTVNGELIMFPGDTSKGASAENIVNCRCAETFTTV